MEEKRDLLLIEQKNSIKNNDKFYEYINNLSELCKDAPRLFFSATNENKRKLLKLVCPNPKVIGSKVILEPITVFENIKNIQKLKKLELMRAYPNSDYIIKLYDNISQIDKIEFIRIYNEIIQTA